MKHILIVAALAALAASCAHREAAQTSQSNVQSPSHMTRNDGDATVKTDAEWKKMLTTEQYDVLRKKGTEAPFSGKHLNQTADGTYMCAGCGAELFTSADKFDTGCGWPSYTRAMDDRRITEHVDTSHGMTRTEVTCTKCGGHLGHVFDDGPAPTGLRYCINSASLDFKKK